MLAKVPNKKTETVGLNALIEQAHQLPTQLYKSLEWDRGLEMASIHKRFTLATNIAVYFCDPRSPWQRGSNEEHQWPASILTFPKRRICRYTHRNIWTRLLGSSTSGHDKTLEFATDGRNI